MNDLWTWIDHGTPPGTIVDSKPAVLVTTMGPHIVHRVFVRGVDGRLYENQHINAQESVWLPRGFPPALGGKASVPSPAVRFPLIRDPTVTSWNDPGLFVEVFSLDAGGNLQQMTLSNVEVFFNGESRRFDTTARQTWTNHGLIGKGLDKDLKPPGVDEIDEVISEGIPGDGSPTVVHYTGGVSSSSLLVHHMEVFLTTGSGDLIWREGVIPDLPGGLRFQQWRWHAAALRNFVISGGGGGLFCDVFGQFCGTTRAYPAPIQKLQGTPTVVLSGPKDATGKVKRVTRSAFTTSVAKDRRGRVPDQIDLFELTGAAGTSPVLHVSPFGKGGGARSTPAAIVSGDSVDLLIRSGRDWLYQLHRNGPPKPAAPGSPFLSPNWTWSEPPAPPGAEEAQDKEGAVFFTLAGVPQALSPQRTGLVTNTASVFSVRGNGSLIEAEVSFGAGSSLAWQDHHGIANVPQPVNNKKAIDRGCTENGALIADKIFPSWVSVVEPRSKRSDPRIYPEAGNYNTGYLAEVQQELVGTVVHSRVTPIDLPISHSRRARGQQRRVANDWNLMVAPDVEYQHLLSDANVRQGGVMEIEWEQDDKSLSTDAIPGPGARVYIKGRWIFDCGHPPYRTEIHPPNILATLDPSKGSVRFSPNGGPVWFQTLDRNLPRSEPEPTGDTCVASQRLSDELAGKDQQLDFISDTGLANLLWAAEICERKTDLLDRFPPERFCYQDHRRGYVDPLDQSLNAPLSFTLPLSTDGAVNPSISVFSSEPTTGFRAEFQQSSENPHGPGFAISIDPASLSPNPHTVLFEHDWGFSKAQKRVVCFEVQTKKNHDDFEPGFYEQAGAVLYNAGVFLGFGEDYVTCSKDKTQEPILYFHANHETIRDGETRPGLARNCVEVKLFPEDVLNVGASGYECDLACSEHWDDDLFNAHNDIMGVASAAFDRDDGFGEGTHRLFSESDPRTARALKGSHQDYVLTVKIGARKQ